MATLEKNPSGIYQVRAGDSLSRIASSQGRSLSDLLAANPQFQSNPNLIQPGQTVNLGAPASNSTISSTPSYQSLVGNSQGIPQQPTRTAQPKMSFSEALTQILKDAQQAQQTGSSNLLKQKQGITSVGLNQAAGVSDIPVLTPQARIGLRDSAIGAVQPGELSVNNQIQLANQGFGNAEKAIEFASDNYQKEQDRIERAAQDAADRAYKDAVLAETKRSNLATEGISRQKAQDGGGTGGIYDQLDYRTANAVIAQGNQFGTSDIVKKYNNIIAASNLIKGVDPYTQNPAEHQAVIYNFAKALDPDSVVREGEYATVKKYSQSLLNKYGGEIKQAIAGTGFLSPGAIQAIQQATDNRIKAYEPQYKNLRTETANRINNLAGKNVADVVLLDYEQGYSGNNDVVPSKFDYLQKDITIQGDKAILPRSVWDTIIGGDKDALLAEAKADGYTLLIK